MSDENISDSLLRLQWRAATHGMLDDKELIAMFDGGNKSIEEGIASYERKFSHVVKNIRITLNARETNPTILTRRYVGLMQQLEGLHDAVFKIRCGYADIWQALEEALGDAPIKAVSSKARLGFIGRMEKNPRAREQAAAMKAIKSEWTKRKRAGLKFSATSFAKEMATKYKNIVTPEHLKNQQTDWNRKFHPAR